MESAESLFDRHIPFAMHLAKRRSKTTPQQVALDELFSAALEGLWNASRRFDESLGFQFTTYASRVIWGSMQDYLRSLDRYPRWFPEEEKREHYPLFMKDGKPYDPGTTAFDPVDRAVSREENAWLRETISGVHGRNLEILIRWSIHGEMMKSLAERFGVTEGRISQICTREKEKLRALVAKRDGDPPVRGRGVRERERGYAPRGAPPEPTGEPSAVMRTSGGL